MHTCSCSAHGHSGICFDAKIEAKLFIEYKCQYCMWCKTNESKYVPLKERKKRGSILFLTVGYVEKYTAQVKSTSITLRTLTVTTENKEFSTVIPPSFTVPITAQQYSASCYNSCLAVVQ